MADREKKGNAFTNNPIVKAIGYPENRGCAGNYCSWRSCFQWEVRLSDSILH